MKLKNQQCITDMEQMLDSLRLATLQPVRVYLLEKVQHMIGGFAKGPESPPGKSATVAQEHLLRRQQT